MAVQNDNTVLNKGDLKAYHERIAPMLGGTFMVGTNNSDYYSTDEKVVGVWMNGKPIYQKTVVINQNLAANAGYTLTAITGIDEIVNHKYKMAWQNMTSGITRVVDDAWTDLTTGYTDICLQDGQFKLRNTFAMGLFWITVQYTKTADAAGSATTTPGAYDINFPYTWPANQEIFFGNGVYGYRATGNVASNKDNQLPISGVKKFYGYGGSSDNGAGANIHTFPYTNPSTLPTWGNCVWADHNNGIPHIYWGTGYTTNTTFDIWIKYSK